MPKRATHAFTLVELLMAIAIIGILVALLMSALREGRRSGWTAQSAHNLQLLAAANMGYLTDNGCYAPAEDKTNLRRWHGARHSLSEPFDSAGGFLAPYLGKSRAVTPCPMFQDMLKGKGTFEEGTGGYGYNAQYIGGLPGGKWNSNGTKESAVAGIVQDAPKTVMFTSSAYARAEGLQEYPYCEPPFWDFGRGPTGNRPSPSVHFRFNGKALVAWCDGHVTMEAKAQRAAGTNPHGGDADKFDLGWFGPDDDNGYWNPAANHQE